MAIELEQRAEEALQRQGLGSSNGPSEGQNGNDSPLPLAERLEQVAQRAEDACQRAAQARLDDEARRAQEGRKQEEAVHRAEEEARGAEARRLAEDAKRAQEVQLLEEMAQRTEQSVQRAEQLCREVAAGRAEDAREREEAARRVEKAAQRAEQFVSEEKARRAEDVDAREEAARWVEQAAQRLEQRCRELEAGRAEEAREREEAAQRAERAAQRAEQFFQVEDVRRAVEARKLEEAAKLRVAEQSRMRRLVFAALAVGAVLNVPARGAGEAFEVPPPRAGLGDMAQVGKQNVGQHETLPADLGVVAEDSEESLSSGLDGGTELTKLVTQALPFPKGALPQQMSAPCPASAEDINGYCWKRFPLSPADVRDGMCDRLHMYEPSDGWCRAHNAGYRPVYVTRRSNNTVDPQ